MRCHILGQSGSFREKSARVVDWTTPISLKLCVNVHYIFTREYANFRYIFLEISTLKIVCGGVCVDFGLISLALKQGETKDVYTGTMFSLQWDYGLPE